MYRELKSPVSVQIEITESCNNNCLHCYNHWRQSNQERSLLTRDIERICSEIKKNEVFDVTITGGEPLLVKERLFHCIYLLKEKDISFSINSNLRLLTNDYAVSLWKAGARIFLTSILSYDECEHNFLSQREGSFTETINGIKNALNMGFIVAVNMVLTKINIKNLFRTAEYLASLGIKNFSATKVSPALDLRDMKKLLLSKEEIEGSLETLVEVKNRLGMNINVLECYPLCLIKDGEKYSELISRNCAAGINTLTIGANGDIRPCSHSNLFYGNIFEENLETIWRKMDDWRSGKYVPVICRECPFLKQCTGGCRMDASFFGDISGLDPNAMPEKISEVKLAKPIAMNNEEDIYSIPNYKTRKEEFGYFIFGGKANFSVNVTGYQLLEKIKESNNGKGFSLNSFTNDEGDFLKHLVQIGFLQSNRGGKDYAGK